LLPRSGEALTLRVSPRGFLKRQRGATFGPPLLFCSIRSGMRRLVTCIALVLMFADANSALASWWLVRSSDGKCLVVDIEPTDKDKNVTKIGKDVYPSADQAEADAKRICTEAKPQDKSAPHAE
jgi:hypothetical protein